MEPVDCDPTWIDRVLTAATRVHTAFGPDLLESVYESAMMVEPKSETIRASNQIEVPVFYCGERLGLGFRADIRIEDVLLLELKAVDTIQDIHIAKMITYLRLLHPKRGYILNFNVRLLKHGIERISI